MKIIHSNGNGSVALVIPSPEYLLTHTMEELIAATVPKGAEYAIVNDAILPEDQTFFNAWEGDFSNGTVTTNMGKARDIQRGTLRDIRAPILAQLDTDYIRADEAGDGKAKAAIAAKKQALRDVTADPAIEAAQTPEELAAVIPDVLAS